MLHLIKDAVIMALLDSPSKMFNIGNPVVKASEVTKQKTRNDNQIDIYLNCTEESGILSR